VSRADFWRRRTEHPGAEGSWESLRLAMRSVMEDTVVDETTRERWAREDLHRKADRIDAKCPECGYVMRTDVSVLDSAEALTCPSCYTVFSVEGA
jgi:uncharacterized C2H2 Zn-finger protein